MLVKKFEDLIAWQKAQDLAVEIYASFRKLTDFSFRDQICKAAVSISNNIAEGFDRGTDKEFKRFLDIAKGSASETKSMVYLAKRLDFIDAQREQQLINDTAEVVRIIGGLIKSLNIPSNRKGKREPKSSNN
jgi:four helix bundle protein